MSYTKAIFDRLCSHLAERAEHTARVAYGHACEQWISSEAFVALNWPQSQIQPGTFVKCECRKRDIVLFEGDDDHCQALATIEAKIVHPNKNLDGNLVKLLRQSTFRPLGDESENFERGAIVYAVWPGWSTRRSMKTRGQFEDHVRDIFLGLFEGKKYVVGTRDRMRPVVENQQVVWNNESYPVSVAAIYASRSGDAGE